VYKVQDLSDNDLESTHFPFISQILNLWIIEFSERKVITSLNEDGKIETFFVREIVSGIDKGGLILNLAIEYFGMPDA